MAPQFPSTRQGEFMADQKLISAHSSNSGRISWGAAAALLGGSSQPQADGDAGGSDDDSDDEENSKRVGGRGKIRIEPIQDKNKRQITFNKRKNGILKKVVQSKLLAKFGSSLLFKLDCRQKICTFSQELRYVHAIRLLLTSDSSLEANIPSQLFHCLN